MAKKKARRVTVVRTIAAPAMATTTARAAPAAPRGKKGGGGKGMKTAVASVAGGAIGALVGGLLVRSGVDVKTAAFGVAAAGTVGAFTLSGPAKAASVGAAAAGAGQLALGWLAGRTMEQDAEAAKADIEKAKPKEEAKKRQGFLDDPRVAFEEARRREFEDAYEAEVMDAA